MGPESSLTAACVWTGNKYGPEYVERLRNAVRAHLPPEHRFIALTDHENVPEGVEKVDISRLELPGWWGKLALFDPELRGPGRCLYFDLDTVITGDLTPLAEWDGVFGICENFTRLAGHTKWPCRYGSCVMSFSDGWGAHVFEGFMSDKDVLMGHYRRGDQQVVEYFVPHAQLLQHDMPEGFFLGYRDLENYPDSPPEDCSIVVFAGSKTPQNYGPEWVRRAWSRS